MAAIRLLHWNIETYGPTKFVNGNNAAFISYIAQLIHNTNANIFSMVEVKNSISANVPGLIAADAHALSGIIGPNPWRSVRINSQFNNEAYIMMFRTDQNFQAARATAGGVVNGIGVNPDHGQGMDNVAGNRIQFPSRWTAQGGRRPFYVTFETTDTNHTFSVISYHAMFGNATPLGVDRLPALNYIHQFDDGPPATAMYASLIAGDFNEDFDPANPNYYQNMLNLPSVQATNNNTSLMNNPPASNDPNAYLVNAYDNIFQTIIVAAPAGNVIDLMVESANVPAPQPAPPAAQPNVGNLSAAAGAFNIAHIPNNWAANPVAVVPPTNMPQAWGFVREAISNHYPVFSVVNI